MSEQEEILYTGEVIWFHIERGYGFLSWEKDDQKQDDMFIHYSDIAIDGFKLLKAGQMVTFTLGENNEGRAKAINVTVVGQ